MTSFEIEWWIASAIATLIIMFIFRRRSIIKYFNSNNIKQASEQTINDIHNIEILERNTDFINKQDLHPTTDQDESVENVEDDKNTESDIVNDNQHHNLKYNKLIPTEIPYSLQQFIDWTSNIINTQPLLDMDWNKIEEDIKNQCKIYENNRDRLKRLYYNYDAPDKNDWTFKFVDEYNMINKNRFDDQHSIIHFIFCSLFGIRTPRKQQYGLNDDKMHKVRITGCKIVKLLIENGIINGDEIFLCYSFGVTIFEEIADALKTIGTMQKYSLFHEDNVWKDIDKTVEKTDYKQYQMQIIDALIDLMAVCMNLNYNDTLSNAIIRNEIICSTDDGEETVYWLKPLTIWDSGVTFSEPLRNQCFIPNNYSIIKKLLFRGIQPFTFQIKQCKRDKCPINYDKNNEIFYETLSSILKEEIINDQQMVEKLWSTLYKDDEYTEYEFSQILGILSPLLFYEYFYEAKQKMFVLLSQCIGTVLMHDMIEIIISYIYINYDLYYNQQFRNNKKIQEFNKKIQEFNKINRLIKFCTEYTPRHWNDNRYVYITNILKKCPYINKKQLYDYNEDSDLTESQ